MNSKESYSEVHVQLIGVQARDRLPYGPLCPSLRFQYHISIILRENKTIVSDSYSSLTSTWSCCRSTYECQGAVLCHTGIGCSQHAYWLKATAQCCNEFDILKYQLLCA